MRLRAGGALDPVRPVTLPPLLLAAACLAVGDAVGLLAGDLRPGAAAAAPLVLLFFLLLLLAFPGGTWLGRPILPRARAGLTAAACLACFGTGLALGARGGAAAATACTASLADGQLLAAAGTLEERGTLRDVTLVGPAGRCRLPRLRVGLGRASEVEEGRRVLVRGRWRERAGSRIGRRPEETGRLLGRVVPGADAGGVPGRDADGVAGSGPPAGGLNPGSRGGTREALRAAALDRLRTALPPDLHGVAAALVLAETSDLDPALRRRFADAGLAHLLAISGLHVGLLSVALLRMAGAVTRRRWRLPATACAVGAYVCLIGAPPAAVRAGLLFAGWSLARARGAPARLGDLAGLAAALAIVADPHVLARAGFQLSFAGFGGLLAGDRAARRLLAGWGARRTAGPLAGAPPAGRWGARRLLAGSLARRVTPRRGGRPRRRGELLVRAGAASAGAFLLTAPIAAAHFERVAPASVVSSLVATPLVALALAGLFGTVLLPPPLFRVAADGATGALRLLERTAALFADLPLHGSVAPPGAAGWACLALLATAGAVWLSGPRPWRAALPLGLAAAVWLVAPAWAALRIGDVTLVCSLDVGQGDAAAVRTRRGRWILLDAGPGRGFQPARPTRPDGAADRGSNGAAAAEGVADRARVGAWSPMPGGDAGRRIVVPFLRSRGAREVEVFVLSHPHLDHMGGAKAVFDAFPVRRVLEAARPLASYPYLGFLDGMEEEGARWLPARAGARLRVDEVRILVLGPGPSASARGPSAPAAERVTDPNEVSVAVRLQVGPSFVYLNTGDASVEVERELLRAWPADSLRADVLKLGHHGSRTSTDSAWIAAVRPRLAIVSAGRGNRYGHPHPEIMGRLRDAGVERVWRTDRSGTLCLRVGAEGAWRLPEPEEG